MIVVNVSAEPVLVGSQYLLPKERREVSRRAYERAKANHPVALKELSATRPTTAEAETPAEEKAKPKSKNTRRKKNVTETKTRPDADTDSVVDDRDAGPGPGD